MKLFRFWTALLLFAPLLAIFAGCGGGGGSNSSVSPTATPKPAPTATLGARVLVVQLRDRAGQPVDGIVTVGATVLATGDGNATFNRNVAAGRTTVSAEVDGDVTTATVDVKTAGTTITTLTITPRVTPAPTATLPPPPF